MKINLASTINWWIGTADVWNCRLILKNFFAFVEIQMNLIWKFKFFRDPILHISSLYDAPTQTVAVRCDAIMMMRTTFSDLRPWQWVCVFIIIFIPLFLLCTLISSSQFVASSHNCISRRKKIIRVLTCINITPNCSDAAREALKKITQICFINKLHI